MRSNVDEFINNLRGHRTAQKNNKRIECENEFFYERNIEVTYSSRKMD